MDDIYKDLNFRILPKNSASPTMMIINKKTNQIYKLWLSDDNSDEAKGLDYENRVYAEKIKPMLDENPDLPLLSYIGYGENTVQKLQNDIGIYSKEAQYLFTLAIFIFLREPHKEGVKWDKEFFDDWKSNHHPIIYSNQVLLETLSERVKILILPTVKFTSLHDCLPIMSTSDIKTIIKKIVVGIFYMYKNGLVHNDLHSGNIMIENGTGKVLIFDWDRAYMNGQANPLLSDNICNKLCSSSQCNIFNTDDYAIDIYKILHYILKTRRNIDSEVLLNDLFDIHSTIFDFFKLTNILNTLTNTPFFNKLDYDGRYCTFLQKPDKNMLYVMDNFGTIGIIFAKTNPEIADILPINDTYSIELFRKIVGVLVVALTVGVITVVPTVFGFNQPKTVVDSNLYLGDNDLSYKSLQYLKNTNKYEKPLKNIQSRNIIIDDKDADDIRKLSKISPNKATYGNLHKAYQLMIRLRDGKVLPISQKPVSTQGPLPKPVYISEIIDMNYNRRKIEINKWRDVKKL